MSKLYFSQNITLTTGDLLKASAPAAMPAYARLPASLQSALVFAWQWIHGTQAFEVSTSGSTGRPQTLVASRQRMKISIESTQQALLLNQRHIALLCISADFIGGKMMLARALHLGMDIVCVPPSAHPLRSSTTHPNFLALVPLQLQTVLEDDPELLTNVHAVLVGGAPVSLALEKTVRQRVSAPVYSTYGMTETLSHIALRRLNGPEASDHFQVLGDTQITADKRGCLNIRGSITKDEWLITNDLVTIRNERQFIWRGRFDWVINSGGVKVSPERVESVIEKHLSHLWPQRPPRFLVAGVPDPRLGERVVVLIESDSEPAGMSSDWLNQLSHDLPIYHAPREVHYIATFVETASGKIDRRATVAQLR